MKINKMTKKEAKYLLKLHNHKIKWCSCCKYPMVVCGKCGLNQCSSMTKCDMCDEAHEIMLSIQYPYRYILMNRIYEYIIDPIILKVSNTKYYIEEGWKKLWKKKK